MSRKEHIIRSYINAYNQFDIPGMVANLHDNIIFKNIQDGETNLLLQGKKEFRQQAELTKTLLHRKTTKYHICKTRRRSN
nr:hypothetical protein [Elizabethkingia bruuniana]